MTDNKFTTMMLRKENLCEQAAVEHESDGYDALASAARDEASDWRAMREAWEAMVVALDAMLEYARHSEGCNGPYGYRCKCNYDNEAEKAKSALTKAMVE